MHECRCNAGGIALGAAFLAVCCACVVIAGEVRALPWAALHALFDQLGAIYAASYPAGGAF